MTSMMSLFMAISGGLDWGLPVEPLRHSYTLTAIYLIYISFALFALLNLITGVFCQKAIASAESDQELMMQDVVDDKQRFIDKFDSLFKIIDAKQQGFITFQMFQENCHETEVQVFFEALELQVDDAWELFKLMDMDKGASIDPEEFLLGCLKLRGHAKAFDMAKLLQASSESMKWQSKFMRHVENEFTLLHAEIARKVRQKSHTQIHL
mmetsp:Transcript_6035/g.10854  ORF Transcript_6035/g.10854 Transcript_6035/m.10854 type:complete len:209 (+) Transcript_6035:3-629(+)